MSYDIRVFKDILLRPASRMLFRKQARRNIALIESSPTCSQSSGDEEYDDKAFIEKRREELLAWKFRSEIDRKLLLGMIERHVELGSAPKAKTSELVQASIND